MTSTILSNGHSTDFYSLPQVLPMVISLLFLNNFLYSCISNVDLDLTHHYLVVKSNLSLSHMFASIRLVEIVCCYCKLPCNTHKIIVTCWTQFLLKLIISYEGMELKVFCLYFYTYHNKIRYVCMTISRTPSALVLHMYTKSIGEKLTA